MKAVVVLLVIFALSTCWVHANESEVDNEKYSQTDIHHYHDTHSHRHSHPHYDAYHGYSLHPHSMSRGLVNHAHEEPCYPAPCSGIHRRTRKQLSSTVVQVPYPVPIYKTKVRVVKVRMPNAKRKVDNRKYLLKVENPPQYTSSKPRCNNTVVEADKRALAQINAKINDRRKALDKHDHWLLDAKRAVTIVENELKHTNMKKELVQNQIQDLINIRNHWGSKLRTDEIKWDIEQAQRTLLQLNDHKEVLQAHAEDVRKKFQKEAKRLAKLNQHIKDLPVNNLDVEDLTDFNA